MELKLLVKYLYIAERFMTLSSEVNFPTTLRSLLKIKSAVYFDKLFEPVSMSLVRVF